MSTKILASGGRVIARPLLLLALLATSACGLAMDNEARLERAEQAYDAEDYRSAIIDTRNVLRDEPGNVAARLLLGRAALRVGDPQTAEKELRRALELGAESSEVGYDLGRAMLLLGRFEEMLDEIRPDMAADEDGRLAILRLRADAMMGLQLPGSARDVYEEVLAADPADSEARLGLASTYVAEQEYDEARAILDALLDAEPDSARAWLSYGGIERATGNLQDAEAAYEKAAALADADTQQRARMAALTALAEVRLDRQDVSGAKEALGTLREIAPGDPAGRFLTARIAFLEEDLDAAQTELDQLVSMAPQFMPAKLLLGAVHLRRGNLGQAEMHLSAVVSQAPDNDNARKLLAETRLQQNRADEAAQLLEPLLGSGNADAPALGLAIRASLQAGEYDNAIQYLTESVAADPDNLDLKLDLAAAYLAAGRADEAEEVLSSVEADSSEEASYRREFLEVIVPLRREDMDTALSEAQAMAERWPEDARVRTMIGGIAMSMERMDLAREALLEAQRLDPSSMATYLNLARIETETGNLTAAREQYLAALERQPDSAPLMVALARLEGRMGNRDKAVEWLQKARAEDAEAALPRLVLARIFLAEQNFDAAAEAASEVVRLPDAGAEAYHLLGLARQGQGAFADAVANLQIALRRAPDEQRYRTDLARAQLAMGNTQAAEETLTRDQGAVIDDIRSQVILAAVRSQEGDVDGALQIARRLQARYPDNGATYALEGEILADAERWEESARAFDKALSIDDGDRNVTIRSYRVRVTGELGNPEAPLLDYLEQNPEDAGVRLVLAQAYQLGGSREEAITEYRKVVDAAPENFTALNNLAWELLQAGDPRAEEYAQRAYELAPQNDSVVDTLGWIQVQTGNLQQGIETLRRAVELSGGRAQVKYHLAAALAQTGETAEARRVLEEILADGQEFSSRDEAENLLSRL